MLPLWATLSFTAAMVASAQPLVQEKFKADGFAVTFWIRVVIMILSIPVMLYTGMPTDWKFYFYTAITCVIYSVTDVVYYRAIPLIGSGMARRLMPASFIIAFLLWFLVDPALRQEYLTHNEKMVAIIFAFGLFAYCSVHLRRCPVSWPAIKLIWPAVAGACIGPIFTKLALNHADALQGTPTYCFFQSALMALFLYLYYTFKKPITHRVLTSPNVLRTGIIIGILATVAGFLKIRGYQLVDNPAFVSIIAFTDGFWVMLIYKITGRKEEANIWAGVGIIICAIILALINGW